MKFIDIVGEKYGRLTVKECIKNEKGMWICKCECDCGNETNVYKSNLMSGYVKSCGCIRKEKIINRSKNYNKFEMIGEYVIGYDCNGNTFYFDIEDYSKVKDISWRVHKDGCVMGYYSKTKKYIKMHRLIMNCINDDIVIDHINHKRNDNRKENLRKSTISENMRNVKVKSNNTSGYTGVVWNKVRNKWMSRITFKKKKIFLGYFDNIEDAVKARKNAEEKYFGDRSYENSMKMVKEIKV